MANQSVVIHCNADLERGMGHLARSLCLAEEARGRGWQVVVAGHFGGRAIDHASALVPGLEIISLRGEDPLEELRGILSDRSAVMLHIDSYDKALDSFESGSVFVSNMRDGSFGRRPADLHIDANLDAELRYRQISENEIAIVGASGMQVRSAIRRISHKVRGNLSAPFQVLVLLGGTDPLELTPRLARQLAAFPELQLTVICRPEMQPALRQALRGLKTHPVQILAFTSDLPMLADSMDVVITAAGTSVWDFAAAGIPMGIIAVTENQLPGYRSCESHGLGLALGEPPHPDLDVRIADLVARLHDRDLLEAESNRGPTLVDGLGAWRVVSAWENMVRGEMRFSESKMSELKPGLKIRHATKLDADQLFGWRNDDLTRASSRSTARVSWADHLAWLNKTILDSERKLLIVEYQGTDIGTVRWDRRGGRAWEASITLAPTHRGQGLGGPVLAAGESVFEGTLPTQLLAGIHISNKASQRIFSRAGYLPYSPANELGFEMCAKWLLA